MREKEIIRRAALAARGAIPEGERDERSAAACEKLLALSEAELGEGARVAAYSALGSEVDVSAFVCAARERGWRVCYPAMMKEEAESDGDAAAANAGAKAHMEFWEVPAAAEAGLAFLEHPARPISGNDAALALCRPVAPAELDAVVVPLVAFDAQGGRLGYGGGNYDRLLCALRPDTFVCGIAFAEQQVSELPLETHDEKLPRLVVA